MSGRRCAAHLAALLVLVSGLVGSGTAQADPIRTASVELSQATLFYREAGKGRPAVLISALLIDSRLWLDQLKGLSAQRRLIASDLSGFGFSSPMNGDKVSSQRYADEVIELLDALRIREPVDFVGLSGGGVIAALICARQPQRCHSLVPISTVFTGALDPACVRYRAENARTVVIEGKDTLFRRFNDYIVGPGASLTARARYRTMLEQTPYESCVAFLTTSEALQLAGVPAQIKAPVMIPVGQGDTVLTPAMAEKVAKDFPDARVVTLPSVGRLLPLESPEALNRAIAQFWGEIDTRGAAK